MNPRVEATERALRGLFASGEYEALATMAIREYGPEIFGLLSAQISDRDEAREAFSLFCEDLWRGLRGFRWESTLRVWAYTLARHAALRHRKRRTRERNKQLPLSQAGAEVAQGAAAQRSSTLLHLRSEIKNRMRQLRERLPIEEQELLILRVDKGMSFRDLAQVMARPGEPSDPAELARRSARLRKRFQLAKERLRALARAEGLLGSR